MYLLRKYKYIIYTYQLKYDNVWKNSYSVFKIFVFIEFMLVCMYKTLFSVFFFFFLLELSSLGTIE